MRIKQSEFSRPQGMEMKKMVTFCSCVPCRTELEQIPTTRETAIMWLKDAAAGAGLVIFMVSSFLLAGGAQSLLSGL